MSIQNCAEHNQLDVKNPHFFVLLVNLHVCKVLQLHVVTNFTVKEYFGR